MSWTDAELDRAADLYEAVLVLDDYEPNAIATYLGQTRRFLRWRKGQYVPRGVVLAGRPTPEGPADTHALRAQLTEYEEVLRRAGRKQRTLDTYLGQTARFIRWLGREFTPQVQERSAEFTAAGARTAARSAAVTKILRAITRDDVLAAMSDLDRDEIGDFGPPTRYELVFDGKRYPPKAAVGLAAQRLIGRPLSHNDFSGGNNRTQANGVLRALGFEIDVFRPMEGQPELPRSTPGSDWTDAEILVSVDTYFDMLHRQLDGQAFIKRAIETASLERLAGRTRGSLEFKLENISAVLDRLELSWLDGFVPAHNYQRRLEDAVVRTLTADPALAAQLRQVDEAVPPRPPVRATEDVLVPPPVPGHRDGNQQSGVVRGSWAGGHDEANKKLGTDGEKWVVELEKEKLQRAGRPDLAARVQHVALEVGDGLGYDVASFEPGGHVLHIEVKTTKSGSSTAFGLSPNEIRVSKREPECFRLYRVFRYGPEARYYILAGDLEAVVDLTPTQYSARPKANSD